MNIQAIENFLEEIKSDRIKELTEFKNRMLSEDVYVHQYILKLHYGDPTICDNCGAKNSFAHLLKKKEITTGILFRCKGKGCHYRIFTALKNTVIAKTKIRATKYAHAINKSHRSVRSMMEDKDIDVYQKSAERIFAKLKKQGISPRTNKEIIKAKKDIDEIKKSCDELQKLVEQYAILRMFEVTCEQFFKKTKD